MPFRGAILVSLQIVSASAAVPPTLRLDDSVRPARYEAELTLATDATTFSGAIDIDVELARPLSLVWLNAVDLAIREADVRAGGKTLPAKVEPGDRDFVGLRVPGVIPAGPARLHIRYEGKISTRDTAGLFQGRDGSETYLYTQFESLDARRAFPCFDQPNFKTPWQLTLHVPKEHTAVSNTPEVSETAEAGGMKKVVFAPTRPLPSYLVALAVGPFDVVDAGRAGKNRIRVRIIAPKGKAYQAKYAAEVTAAILQRLENYFGIPYPYEKADQVAIPLTFGFGAMENAGMVTYAQSIILGDPALDTAWRQRQYAATAAHELAHQWFGDLVTPEWWDDIWLNEAFATWMEMKILAEWKPEWNTRLNDLGAKFGAMNEDSLTSTRRIRQPIESVDDISNAFDDITYQKGSAVIRMFESWAGEKQFQAGVTRYLKRYAYQNATVHDFLEAVASTRQPLLARAFTTFLEQPGFPEISIELKCDGAPRVTLRQKRYVPTGSVEPKLETWQVPVCVRYPTRHGPQRECFLLNQARAEFRLTKATGCPTYLTGNSGAAGYYQTAYEGDLVQKLLENNDAFLSAPERRTLLHDLASLAQAREVRPNQVLAAVIPFAKARERLVVAEAQNVAGSVRRLVPESELSNYHRFVRKAFGERAYALGWSARPGDDSETRLERASLMPFVAVGGEDSALQSEARRLADGWLRDRKGVDPDMLTAVLATAAHSGDRALFDALLGELRKTKDRQIRRSLFDALASFRDPTLAEDAMALVLEPDLDPRESLGVLFGPTDTPGIEELPFSFVKTHYDELANRLPVGGGSDARTELLTVGRSFCDADSRQQFASFFEERSKQFLGGPRTYAQMIEKIRLCEARVETQRADVAQFLAAE